MNNIFYVLIFNFLSVIVIILLLYPNTKKEINLFSAYYNSEGAFAGFIQKKQNLYRACEFSTNVPLLYRCRQSDFAKIVSEIRGVGTSVVSRSGLTRKFGKMAADSICSSIRLDDGNGMSSESDSSLEKLVNYLASMLGFSNT